MEAGCTRTETAAAAAAVPDKQQQQQPWRTRLLPLVCCLLLMAAWTAWVLPPIWSPLVALQQRYASDRSPTLPASPGDPAPPQSPPLPPVRIPLRRVRVDPLAPHPAARRHFTSHAFFGQHGLPTRAGAGTGSAHARRLLDSDAQTSVGNFSGSISVTLQPLSSSANSSTPPLTPLAPAAAGPPGKVHLRDYSDYMWIGVLGVGTPAQHFGCVFDTGSADTWVFSSAVPSHQRFSWLNYFDSSASSTFESVRRPWSIRYGKGLARGLVSRDTLHVGALSIPGQDLAFTTDTGGADETFSHENEPIDGLFGLGFQKLATPSFGRTVLERARDTKVVPDRVFSFHMISTRGEPDPLPVRKDPLDPSSPLDEVASSAADELIHPDCYFILGAVGEEETRALAPYGVTHVPIVPPQLVEGRWVVEMEGMKSGGRSVDSFCSPASGAAKPCYAWVDTGSSFVLLPSDKYERIMRDIISSRPDCTLSPTPDRRATCTLRNTYLLPHVSFEFAGREFRVSPEEYVVDGADDAGALVFLLGFSPRASTHAEYDEIILGDTFLKKSVGTAGKGTHCCRRISEASDAIAGPA